MYLDNIVADKYKELEELRSRTSAAALEKEIAQLPPCRGFEASLRAPKRTSVGLIAEVKKASPSKGLIRPDFHPVELAADYEAAGADCLSVLTDVTYFQGSPDFLRQIKAHTSIPILRKDFTVGELQVLEARAMGADAILLIAAILTDQELNSFHRLAKEIGLDVLVEVHDREEMERVLQTDATLIGINNRNLKTFVTDLAVTEQLMSLVPQGAFVVSESGLSTADDIARVRKAGSRAVLIGEHFMRQPDVGQAVIDMLGPLGADA